MVLLGCSTLRFGIVCQTKNCCPGMHHSEIGLGRMCGDNLILSQNKSWDTIVQLHFWHFYPHYPSWSRNFGGHHDRKRHKKHPAWGNKFCGTADGGQFRRWCCVFLFSVGQDRYSCSWWSWVSGTQLNAIGPTIFPRIASRGIPPKIWYLGVSGNWVYGIPYTTKIWKKNKRVVLIMKHDDKLSDFGVHTICFWKRNKSQRNTRKCVLYFRMLYLCKLQEYHANRT